VGLRSWFRGRQAQSGAAAATVVASEPSAEEPLTAVQLAELQDAWAELAEATKDSAVKSFHACTRNGKPWQEDPASVRSMAAMLRSFPAEDSSVDTKPAG
jgi:hypothetical protein